ncbi:peptide-binding protein [Pelagivirga sediminicola]|uniref:Peptide-binding protein n=1 Tax=Pelagivirga sediminicola TaxID=2170575 RepID=A0A2T7GC61_9RHOB|nr:SH3 domain-containing protein [Pelagivirga sediminicola]PVA11968.1 peptide-binding protein [Pelagivirga sediminicola]
MHKAIFAALAILPFALSACAPMGGPMGYYEVFGVEEGDMLKLRAGPGTGFDVIAGLPNGTVLRLNGCERTGGTRWCEAAMKDGPALNGYVSWAYLRKR